MQATEQKIKNLINSTRDNQYIGISLMVNVMNWSIEDCALFYFLNCKPMVFFHGREGWNQSWWQVGFYDIRFSRAIKPGTYPLNIPDELCDYRCVLYRDPNLEPIFEEIHSMQGNPPVIKFFSEAIKLNLE